MALSFKDQETDSLARQVANLAGESLTEAVRGHPAGLNFDDCFSYALAKTTAEPLPFKGDDFSKTDIKRAM